MPTLRERLEAAETQLAFLAGGATGAAVSRLGPIPAARGAARLAVGTPQGRAVLAGISYSVLRDELNARDQAAAQERFGPLAGDVVGLAQRTQALPLPIGQAAVLGADVGLKARKKVQSKFNKAVSAGMKQVKASTSNGKKGSIKDAKKAFATVTKTVSKIKKGGKVAKKGLLRKIGLAAKKVLK
jgi:hypothetical protein